MQARDLQEPGSSRALPDQFNAAGQAFKKVAQAGGLASYGRSERMGDAVGVQRSETNKRRWTEHEKSELVSGTDEAGEPDRRDPVEGRRQRS